MRKRKVEASAEGAAIHFFLSMLDPVNRGEKFTWEAFPDLVGGLSRTALRTNLDNPTEKELVYARKRATYHAERLCQEYRSLLR